MHALAFTFKPLASDNGKPRVRQGRTIELYGSQEVNGLWLLNDIRTKTRLMNVNLRSRLLHFKTIFHSFSLKIFMPGLPLSNFWLLTMGSQGEDKSETKKLNGCQKPKAYGL